MKSAQRVILTYLIALAVPIQATAGAMALPCCSGGDGSMSLPISAEMDPAMHDHGHMQHQDGLAISADQPPAPDAGCQCGCEGWCAAVGTVTVTIGSGPSAMTPEHCGKFLSSRTRLLAGPAPSPPYRPPALRS